MTIPRHSGARAQRANPESRATTGSMDSGSAPERVEDARERAYDASRNDRSRREFITLLGGAAALWPLAPRAQERERVRRIGVLLPAAADNPEYQARVGAFHQGLALLGWTIGRNVQIDIRWATADPAEIRRHTVELAALAPDVILTSGASTVGPLLQATRTVPIVFPIVSDPVGAGF